MATGQGNPLLRHLRRVLQPRDGGGPTDGQLLGCFIERRDEGAFEALVRRHGAMVLGVCRRVLANAHDAEDAFQATFLVLVRKAASVVPREQVGNWLYGVAYHTALKAKALAGRRREMERRAQTMCRRETTADDPWDDLHPVLDRELERLPDKYRVPVVLCDLEGKTHQEAARQLGWPVGTLSGRLSRARALLARRLAGRGVTLSAGLLAGLLSRNAAAACPPRPLVASTVKAAAPGSAVPARIAALTEGVLKTMLLKKLTAATAGLLAVGLIGLVVAGSAYRAGAAAPAPTKKARKKPAAKLDLSPSASGKLPLPTSPMPFQVLARLDKKGRVALRMVETTAKEQQFVLPNGKQVTGYKVVHETVTKRYDLDEVKVYDTTGKRVDADDLPKRLRKEVVALASFNGEKVDPLHLRVIKEGTLVFVLPAPKPAAGNLVPPPAGPLPAPPAVPAGGAGGVLPPLPAAPAMPPPAPPRKVKQQGRLLPPPPLPSTPAVPPPDPKRP